MNYLHVYLDLIRKAKTRDKNFKGENHHYFPKCIFGDNDKTVKLTFKEHFVAHRLLAKIFEQRYGLYHEYTRKLNQAIHRMVYSNTLRNDPTELQKQIANECMSKAKMFKSRPDMVGKKYFGASEETILQLKEKVSKTRTGMKTNYPKTRKPLSNRTKEVFDKISDSRKHTNDKYIQMSDEEFDDWIKHQQMFTKVKGRKDRPNVNVTRAIIARHTPLKKYYSEDDFSEYWFSKNSKLFYGYDIV